MQTHRCGRWWSMTSSQKKDLINRDVSDFTKEYSRKLEKDANLLIPE